MATLSETDLERGKDSACCSLKAESSGPTSRDAAYSLRLCHPPVSHIHARPVFQHSLCLIFLEKLPKISAARARTTWNSELNACPAVVRLQWISQYSESCLPCSFVPALSCIEKVARHTAGPPAFPCSHCERGRL
ncbi:Hypothetical predicted protein [Podarcis lilfordi]|uniref:Uncharacterized protein n=1 Tax=Podarcis lilfordi TaxID=74358 RepID=A0AA35NY41_9SAUR|nr:Hypothetical predicted protein [Podarcis lilfordi]